MMIVKIVNKFSKLFPDEFEAYVDNCSNHNVTYEGRFVCQMSDEDISILKTHGEIKTGAIEVYPV